MQIRMCSVCAGAFEYNSENHAVTPDTHSDAGEDCPTVYRG